MLLDDIKVFQVTSKWTVFRIPISYGKMDDKDAMYSNMREWLGENCEGTYKLFMISHGIKGQHSYGSGVYGHMLEIDLSLDIDVVAFKLRWV